MTTKNDGVINNVGNINACIKSDGPPQKKKKVLYFIIL